MYSYPKDNSSRVPSAGTNPYQWKNVSIGGGGYVGAVFIHPRPGAGVFLVTNVGGLFRWDEETEKAIPLTDRFTLSQSRFYSMNGLALHPRAPEILYIAAGDQADQTGRPGAIFKSTDLGQSWRQATPADWPVKVGGMNYPWVVQRLALDPHHPNILLYGSNVDGLWRSDDAGETWFRARGINGVSSVRRSPFADESLTGIMCVIFDARIPGRVYAGAYGDGVYQSNDSGATWERIPDSPQRAFQMGVATDGALWVTGKPARYKHGVSRYASGQWQRFNPAGKALGFNALAVNPEEPGEALTATWWRKGSFSHEELYRTTDGGRNWSKLSWKIEHEQTWLPDEDFDTTVASLAYDPHVQGRVWLTGGYGVYRTEAISNRPTHWRPLNKNLENTVVFDLIELENGMLVSALADLSGFIHDRGLESYPSRRLMDGDRGLSKAIYTFSLARTYNKSLQELVRTANQFKGFFSGVMASTDGGVTWRVIKRSFTIPFVGKGYPFQVAVAPLDGANAVVTRVRARALYTRNGGKSWHKVKGLPLGIDNPGAPFTIYARPLAADGALDGRFYYYQEGTVYRSQDGGRTFSPVNKDLPVEATSGFYALHAVAGRPEEIWLNLDTSGLYHSTDGGNTWSASANVRRARLCAVGMAAPGSSEPTLYMYGTVCEEADAIFRSVDGGANWVNIQDPAIPIGAAPTVMEASRTTFGMVYIGTFGRGIYYGEPAGLKSE